MSHPWMPFYVADYLADTRRLSTLEHGAYMLLIMEYWQHRHLPANDADLAIITMLPEKEWKRIRPKIETFFEPGWRHDRIDTELKKADIKSEARAEAGRNGGKAKRKPTGNKPKAIASELLEQNGTDVEASSSQPHSSNEESPSAAREEVSFECRCRLACGSEPIVASADFSPIADFVSAGPGTQADVLSGIAAAMADPSFRPRHWSQIVGWARRATQDRLQSAAKPQVPDGYSARAGPDNGNRPVNATLQATRNLLEKLRERADDTSQTIDGTCSALPAN